MTANEFLELPPASYEATIDAMKEVERLLLMGELGYVLRRSAFAYGYATIRYSTTRPNDTGHEDAVKYANKLIKNVRRTVGRTFPDADADAERLRI